MKYFKILYGVRKTELEYTPAKWSHYSRISSRMVTDCYPSLDNCGDEVQELYDYIEENLKIF